MLENGLEKIFTEKCKDRDIECIKMNSLSSNDLPDRLCITRRGNVIWVELKRPHPNKGKEGKLRPAQELMIKELRDRKQLVYVIKSTRDIDKFFINFSHLFNERSLADLDDEVRHFLDNQRSF